MSTFTSDVNPAFGQWLGNGNETFPSPWTDMASLEMPQTMQHAHRFCEYIVMANGTYRMAIDRILSYFLTDVELEDVDDDDRDKWKTFLEETLDIRNVLHTVGLDAMVYGNSFTSIIPTFKRYLACSRCHTEFPLSIVYNEKVFKFKWNNYEFHAYCPKCEYSGKWRHIDRRAPQDKGFRIKRWNIHEMELLWDPLTDEVNYIWKIPEDYRKMVREGHLFHLERANWEVIQAVKHNNYVMFDKDVVYHMKEDALAGIRNRGWGISRVITNFRQAWYVQVLHRYNEAVALDYVIPFRLITPVPGDKSTGTDVLLDTNAGNFMGQVMTMVRKRRKDPAAWFSLPFPVQYQALGGDAKALAPDTLLAQGIDNLLNAIGCPAEMYKGSLTLQAAPTALRLFESTWATLPHNLNGWLRFVIQNTAKLLNWNEPTARLMRVTTADDANKQLSKLQLMMGGQISQTTGLKSVGLDFKDEIQRQMDDQKYQAEQQSKLQEEMENASQMEQLMQPPGQGQPGQPGAPGGGMPGQQAQPQQGGQAAGGGAQAQPQGQAQMTQQSVVANLKTMPNEKVTPEELDQKAQTVASQLMSMPESQRLSELRQLKQMDSVLHGIVKSKLEQLRSQARTQGAAMILGQQSPQQQGQQKQGSILRFRKRKILI